MYAILQQSGHQYRVSPGDRLVVDRLAAEVGSVVALEPVVLVQGDDGTQVGTPVVDGVRVAAVVVGHSKGGKIRVFKYKPKKHYRRTHGHRSLLTELRVEAVLAKGEKLPEPKVVEAKPAAEGKPAAKGRGRARAKAEADVETAAAVETPAVEAEVEATKAPATTPKRNRTAAKVAASAETGTEAPEAVAPAAIEAPEGADEGAQGAAPAATPEASAEEPAPKRRSRAKKAEPESTETETPAAGDETEA